MNILCDTSFLMVLVTKPIKQLDHNPSYKSSLSAKTVLEITKKFEIINTKKLDYTDDSIIDYAINYKCAVATMDKNLIQRLISSKVMVFSLRNNKLLIMNP